MASPCTSSFGSQDLTLVNPEVEPIFVDGSSNCAMIKQEKLTDSSSSSDFSTPDKIIVISPCQKNKIRTEMERLVGLLNEDLKRVQEFIKTEVSPLDNLENDLKNCKEKLKIREEEISSLKRRLEKAEQNLETRTKSVVDLSRKLSIKKEQSSCLKRDNDQTNDQKQKFQDLVKKMDCCYTENQQLNNENKSLMDKIRSLEDECNHYKSLNQSYEKTIESKSKMIASLRKERNTFVEKLETPCNKISCGYLSELSVAKARILELERELMNFRENALLISRLENRLNDIDQKLLAEMSRNAIFFNRLNSGDDQITSQGYNFGRRDSCKANSKVFNHVQGIFGNLNEMLSKLSTMEQMNSCQSQAILPKSSCLY